MQDVGPTHWHMTRIMRRVLAPLQYSSVLEVGVGFGHNLPVIAAGRKLERLVGVDISGRALEHVRARCAGEFHQLDIVRGHLPERFELVCCALVLEHVSDDDAALVNLRKMSSKYLLLTTMAGDFHRYEPWERQMGHLRNYRPGQLEAKLQRHGWEVTRAVYWGFPFYTPLVRTLQNRMRATRELSAGSRAIARILRLVYFLNTSRRGDLLIVLARPNGSR
jgi:hypothetical protein